MTSYDYWKSLIKDLEQMRYNNGGRLTDVAQIAYSLSHFVKINFPMNGVPDSIVNQLDILKIALESAESLYEETLDFIIKTCEEIDEKGS